MAYSNVQNSIHEDSFIIIVSKIIFYLFVNFSLLNSYSWKQIKSYDVWSSVPVWFPLD